MNVSTPHPRSAGRPRRFEWKETDPLLRREMRERWRRPLTYLLLALYTGIMALLAYSMYLSLVPQNEVDGGVLGLGRPYFFGVAGVQIVISVPLGVMLATPAVAVERERNSIVDYMLAGLTARQIVLAKFWSVGTFSFVLALLPFPVLALCFPLGGIAPGEYCSTFALALVTAVSSAAFGIVISVNEKRVTKALMNGLIVSATLSLVVSPCLYAFLAMPWPLVLMLAFVGAAFIPAFALRIAVTELERLTQRLDDERDKTLSFYISLSEETSRVNLPASQPAKRSSDLSDFFPATSATVASPPPMQTQVVVRTTPKRKLEDNWSFFERKILELADSNPVTGREVRVQMRLWSSLSAPITSLWPDFIVWTALGALLGGLSWWWHLVAFWRIVWGFTMLCAMAQTATLGSGLFTKEREQKTLSTLQLCALSAREIVWGKAFAAILLTSRFYVWLLWGMWVASWCEGIAMPVSVALMTVGGIGLAACLSVTFSLVCRHTSIAASSSLFSLIVLFLLLPIVGASPFFVIAPLVRHLWIEPLQAFAGLAPSGVPTLFVRFGLQIVGLLCCLFALALFAFAAWRLRRTFAEEEHVSFWQRDLSRNWI